MQYNFVSLMLIYCSLNRLQQWETFSSLPPSTTLHVLTTCYKCDNHLFFSAMDKKERLHSGLQHQYSVTIRRPTQLRQALS